MANTKNSFIRLMVIDRCLQRHGGMSTSEILEAVNNELVTRGEEPVTASNTIRTDIDFIANNWHVSIIEEKDGRRRYYHYEDKAFSISKAPLSENELNQLNQTLQMLGRFSGMPSYGWVDDLNTRFKTQFFTPAETKTVVGFENNEYVAGMEFFDVLFNAITHRQTLTLEYRSFKMEQPNVTVISPYYLKQYNNRWFLFACADGYSNLTIYALDRIVSANAAHHPYQNSDIDFEEYFDDIIGVSIPKDSECRLIRLFVTAEQAKYIHTKPIHGSQKIIEHTPGGEIVQLELIPNYELEQLILSFGEKVTVLEPTSFRDRIAGRIRESLKNYE